MSPRSDEQPRSRLVEYDALKRRLWILGQRCHHGATGSIVAAIGCLGLLASEPARLSNSAVNARSMLALAAAGGALMVHDWKDHAIWFERGYGTQP
jgi:hypothetical protein